MLFYNALIYTMKNPQSICKGFVIDQKGIIRKLIFNQQDITELLDSGLLSYNLGGSFVYPGFVDTHTHSFEAGLYEKAANLGEAQSIADLFDILKHHDPINNIIVGYNFDENKLREKRFPSLEELDQIFSDNPCLIRRIDGHLSIINSKVFNDSQLSDHDQFLKLPIKRGSRSDPFNNVLKAEFNDYISNWFHRSIDRQGVINAYQKAASIAVSKGHTSVHTMVGDGKQDLMHYEIIASLLNDQALPFQERVIKESQDFTFPINYILYPQIMNVDKAQKAKCPRIGGCVLADGSFGSGTAALSSTYNNSNKNYGILYKTDEEWFGFINKAHNLDMQVAIHCIGDRAIKQIVKMYCQIQSENPKDLRHQIIHNELIIDDSIINLMKEYNISAVMQPMFDKLWGGKNNMYAKILGTTRALMCNRFKSLLSAGVLTTGSSDWYVTNIDALAGIDAAVTLHNKDERISPFEAVQMYTINAAKLIKQEHVIGTLTEGKYADFVCLNRDIMNDADIASIPIRCVFKKGIKVY